MLRIIINALMVLGMSIMTIGFFWAGDVGNGVVSVLGAFGLAWLIYFR